MSAMWKRARVRDASKEKNHSLLQRGVLAFSSKSKVSPGPPRDEKVTTEDEDEILE